METDRHATDGQERRGDPTPEGTETHAYGYGEDPLEPAGADGQRAADSGPPDPDAAAEGPPGPEGAAPSGPGEDPATGLHPTTGLHGGTAPRAVLRPIPEGFPTPPPRPARPNRRPAPKPDPAAAARRPRPLLIVSVAVAAALLLVVVVGGGVLAMRALSPSEPAAPVASEDQASPSTADEGASGSTEIGDVVITEVSTELGVRAVGDSSSRLEPEGEFVIVTFEVDNPTASGVQIGSGDVGLENADETFPADKEATLAHTAESTAFSVVPPETSMTFHAVFDVPVGTDPTGLRLDLVQIGESGTLPLES